MFPSQFGKEQLAKELEKGPDVGSTKKGEDDENDDKEYSNETLRKYQVCLQPIHLFISMYCTSCVVLQTQLCSDKSSIYGF